MNKRRPNPVRADDLHTVMQVAEYLQVARGTVYGLIARGELLHRRIGGSIRVAKQDLLAYVFREPESKPLAPIGTPGRRSVAALYQDPEKLIDMTYWDRLNAAMARRKGIPIPGQVAG